MGRASAWVAGLRGPKNTVDPARPYAFLHEDEADLDGRPISTATIFLTNKECPYRCVMCDLWRNTLDERTPVGAIPAQIRYALESLSDLDGSRSGAPNLRLQSRESDREVRLEPAWSQIKLYNAGSFFDAQAIPPQDYSAIAEAAGGVDRVIVECHPALIGPRILPFRDMLPGRLEVAVGLETVHTDVLRRLNKRFTVDGFQRAAEFLARHNIALRVFILVRPPYLSEAEGVEWAQRTIDIASDCGAEVCAVIPTRGGNGAMEALAAAGQFHPPSLRSIESVQGYGLMLGRGRVYSDLWDIEKFFDCECSAARSARLSVMNRTQRASTPESCAHCD